MSYVQTRPFGLYVHWPFCVSKCPYCDFNSHTFDTIDQTRWADAYVLELHRVHHETSGRPLSSIFFGGGTPSLMPAKTVERIISTAQTLWGFQDTIEITLEANPTTVENQTFPDFANAGVNRLSIGVQSLRQEPLKFLGRAHGVEDALYALKLAQKHFTRYSFDLIYARPEQTLSDWSDELHQALEYAGDHLSLYQLTIEPGTPFYKDGVPAADEERGADLFDLTQEIMDKVGMPFYEISNHARPDQESRHNLIYWQGDDYIGIGPGAHSRLTIKGQRHAIHQIYKPNLWIDAVYEKKSGEQKRKPLLSQDVATELLLMGLRLRSGINKAHFYNLSGLHLQDCLDPDGLSILREIDFIHETDHTFGLTRAGLECLNTALEKLIKNH